ncbi:MAG TPA: prepilin-type N-terminal cleavage/methylation domain-containing protein [Candidatus Binatia bacterium]|nr:prepilin-type N-terminal cleavage/methylation domain-containing protein [Candidatus Binatia bacterium]
MRTRKRQRGFTLIELLIVVTIILIIAAFTIPKITKAQIPAHETSAIASIKAINEAEMIYSSSHPDVGFTADLATLGGTAQGGGEQTIDNNLASGRKSGYTFTYTPGEKVNGAIRSYTITAVPDQVGSTGQRRFFSDESGEVHYNSAGPADLTSPVIQ